jgi:hypothetical protein
LRRRRTLPEEERRRRVSGWMGGRREEEEEDRRSTTYDKRERERKRERRRKLLSLLGWQIPFSSNLFYLLNTDGYELSGICRSSPNERGHAVGELRSQPEPKLDTFFVPRVKNVSFLADFSQPPISCCCRPTYPVKARYAMQTPACLPAWLPSCLPLFTNASSDGGRGTRAKKRNNT